jgi:anaerobic ribonucleoside-triphosphate reductase
LIKVIKRNGQEVEFNLEKINAAIQKAARKTAEVIEIQILQDIQQAIEQTTADTGVNSISVEEIQDLVETMLMEYKHYKTAQEYIRYRNWRSDQRNLFSKQTAFIQDVINLNNLENENANMNEKLFTAKKGRIVAEVLKDYANKYLLSADVREAFEQNLIYIHDYSTYALGMHNCTTIDLADLLSRGFKTQNGNVRPPTTIATAGQLTAVILQCVSNEQFGGVAVGAMDFALAPYVEMSFQKWLKRIAEFENTEPIAATLENFEEVKNSANERTQKQLDWAWEQVNKETYQACEALIHNLNTLTSRSGNQLPFTSVNYGTDTSQAGRMLMKNFLLARQSGVGENHTTPVFPIGVFRYKIGVNANPGDPNYDIKKLAIETTSKRIYPNFVNVDAPHQAVPINGKPETEACTMGCRTALGVDRHGLLGYFGRGNISPITINLPKIALIQEVYKGKPFNKEQFYADTDRILDLAAKALFERFEYQASQKASSAPFLYENQVLKGPKLKPNDSVREVLKHNTLAIGIIGLSNAMVALFGKHQAEDAKVLEFAKEYVEHLSKKTKEYCEKYDLNFSLYYTPAESLCHKWAKANQKEFGIIEGVTDKDYINNSTHVPVYHECSIKEKIDIESEFIKWGTGGNITYVELDGNARNNTAALEKILDYAMSKGIGYFAINHPIDECLECGYQGIIGDHCPNCGKSEDEVEIKRLRRVTGYLTADYKTAFNAGKKAEVEDRYQHSKRG